jgi:Fur family transcriptional regulator, zinc uptake regulator
MARLSAKDLERRLHAAEQICDRHGARFTELRRRTLALILEAAGPVGAYELLDRLKEADEHKRAAPPTIYRALDFLLGQGLIHRVERLNAFVGCPEPGQHAHTVQFLICRECGSVSEIEDRTVEAALHQAATSQGFRAERAMVEVEGACAACADTSGPRLPAAAGA